MISLELERRLESRRKYHSFVLWLFSLLFAAALFQNVLSSIYLKMENHINCKVDRLMWSKLSVPSFQCGKRERLSMWKAQGSNWKWGFTAFEHRGTVKSKKLGHPCHREKKWTFFHSKLQIKAKQFKRFRKRFLIFKINKSWLFVSVSLNLTLPMTVSVSPLYNSLALFRAYTDANLRNKNTLEQSCMVLFVCLFCFVSA